MSVGLCANDSRLRAATDDRFGAVSDYDGLGDITSKTSVGAYSYPAVEQARPFVISSIAGTVDAVVNPTFTYDPNGNLTGDGTYTYTYDPENRLITAAGGGMSATYLYDPAGRRREKQVTGGSFAGTTQFLDAGDDEIAEYDGSGSLLRRYIPGRGVDQPIAMVTAAGVKTVRRAIVLSRDC